MPNSKQVQGDRDERERGGELRWEMKARQRARILNPPCLIFEWCRGILRQAYWRLNFNPDQVVRSRVTQVSIEEGENELLHYLVKKTADAGVERTALLLPLVRDWNVSASGIGVRNSYSSAAPNPEPSSDRHRLPCWRREATHHKKFHIPSHKLGGAVDRFGDHSCQFALRR